MLRRQKVPAMPSDRAQWRALSSKLFSKPDELMCSVQDGSDARASQQSCSPASPRLASIRNKAFKLMKWEVAGCLCLDVRTAVSPLQDIGRSASEKLPVTE
ncbi:unnamed protein product [Polarella glacialis]|uniref:Uncharacterized protein n=1 Tax=Polarella glacialis TaxID=89957 RepID=A0A813IJB4_POLGL|nr:unnamed protein product [Polarella glacialis]